MGRKRLNEMTPDELVARMASCHHDLGYQVVKNARAQLRRITGMDNEDVGHFVTSGLTWAEYQAAQADNAPEGAEGSTMSDTTIPTAEGLMEGIGEVVSPDRAPYSRLRVNGRTLAYCSTRADGVLLDFATSAVEEAPRRFQKMLEIGESRATVRVTAKNAKGAVGLLEWLAK